MKFYISFSIHGTNTFITASREEKDFENLLHAIAAGGGNTGEFSPIKSRRENYNPNIERKIHWTKLNRVKDNQPQTSPSHVIKLFKRLERQGWKIEDRAFRKYHYG